MQSILEKIKELKEKRRAIILAHNYQSPEVQDIADVVADSLELGIRARETKAEVIVFCGVRFMAEMASILNPEKKVLMPDETAGCPLADTITPEDVRALRKSYPKATFLAYVNTSAAVKAECDICFTSSNVLRIIRSLPEDKQLVVIPDRHLTEWASRETGRELIPWFGECPVHMEIGEKDIKLIKEQHQGIKVMVHPECRIEVRAMGDFIGGTGGMLKYAQRENAKFFAVATEVGMVHRLSKDNPDKVFLPATLGAICDDMKKITLEKVLYSLENMVYEVKVPEDIAERARNALEAMFRYS